MDEPHRLGREVDLSSVLAVRRNQKLTVFDAFYRPSLKLLGPIHALLKIVRSLAFEPVHQCGQTRQMEAVGGVN